MTATVREGIATAGEATPAALVPSPRRRRHDAGAREADAEGSAAAAARGRPARIAASTAPAPRALGTVRSGEPDADGVHAAPGAPLAVPVRSALEQAYGADFGAVRVHADRAADLAAGRRGAHAYAYGEHLVFAAGRYAPGTSTGDRLIAHELAHVLQQRGDGAARFDLQEAGGGERSRVTFLFSVRIDRDMTAEELLVEFVRQYRRLPSAAAAREVLAADRWEWTGGTPRITPADLRRGFMQIRVRDRSLPATTAADRAGRSEFFGGLAPEDQAALNAETDRRFWERTAYDVGRPLDPARSRGDRAMAPYWMALRDDLVRQRQEIDALPPEIHDIIFQPGATRALQPADYATVLRIAARLSTLRPAEIADYANRTTASTGDLAAFEASVERYVAEREARAAAAEARELQMRDLYGLEPLYRRYRELMRTNTTGAVAAYSGRYGGRGVGLSLGMARAADEQRASLTADLQAVGFDSIAAFERAIAAYRVAFRDETMRVGDDLLDRYEHVLWENEERYRAIAAAATLRTEVAATGAPGHYATAERERTASIFSSMTTRDSMAELEPAIEHAAASARATESADTAMRSLGTSHPLLLDPDFPRAALGRADSPDATRTVMLDYIGARQRDIATTRSNLENTPDLVFKLDRLLDASYAAQEVREGSIYRMIIEDYQRDQRLLELVVTIELVIVAVALGVVTAGGGTVGVLAAGASFGLSAVQAVEEYRRYEEMSAAHGAQLLSDDPSFAWVVLAIVGAGLDLAAVSAALRAGTPLRAAVETFNSTGDARTLRQTLDRLTEIDTELRTTLANAAETQAAERAHLDAVLADWFPTGAARASVMLGLDWFTARFTTRLAFAAYLAARRGFATFRRFMLTREATALLGDLTRLTPAQLSRLGRAHADALHQATQIATHGRSLGMGEPEIEYFLRVWGQYPDRTPTAVTAAMDEWAAAAGGVTRRYREMPASLLDDETRALLPDFDRRVAGTGGVESITARRPPGDDGGLSVTIAGEIRPDALSRTPRPGQPLAPSFNTSLRARLAAAGHDVTAALRRARLEPSEWHLLHLWGPGFGDEAAAGMMMGPRSVNIGLQSGSTFNAAAGRIEREGVEAFITELARQARREGGTVRLTANATAWPSPTPGGFRLPSDMPFLRRASYRIDVSLPDGRAGSLRVSIDVAEPPASSATIGLDGAIASLGDLFDL
jgi:hypothetical protein